MPEIALELTLGRGRTLEGREGTLLLGDVDAGVLSRLLDILKDLAIELMGLLRSPRNAELGKDIRKALNTNPDGTMACIGIAAFLRGLKVDVNDLVQVVRENRSNLPKLLKVKLAILYKPRKAERSEITDRGLIRSRVLNDLCTQIAGLDRTQMLLVGLTIGCVLLQEIRPTRLDLRVQNHLPNLLSWN